MGAALAVTVGVSLLQASEKSKAGDIAKRESKIAASQLEVGAVQREADRKERLAAALASQNAAAGAGGIAAFEGSPLSILEADIAAADRATERDAFTTELATMTTRARGRTAKASADTSAFIGLASDFTKAAQAA